MNAFVVNKSIIHIKVIQLVWVPCDPSQDLFLPIFSHFSPSLCIPSHSRPQDCPLTSSSATATHPDEQTALIQELLSLTQREHQYRITSSLRLSNDLHAFSLMRMLLPQQCCLRAKFKPSCQVWSYNTLSICAAKVAAGTEKAALVSINNGKM